LRTETRKVSIWGKRVLAVMMAAVSLCTIGCGKPASEELPDAEHSIFGSAELPDTGYTKTEYERYIPIGLHEIATPEPVVRPAIEDSVNQLISSYGVEGSVAVSVLDNITGEQFICAGANEQYAAWGFYLPVYMAFCDRYPGTSSYVEEKQNMLSHDAGKCNTAANFAIDSFGGTDSITSYIRQTLGYSNTRYGRKFGQTNATDDNYTTAYDAAIMLNQFNSLYNSYDLCYNPSSFGIAVPDGASMYAQLGTENISVKNNLNVFAIMHGYSADYSIVILTKNNASGSGIVNAILQTVHTQMEAYAE